MLKRTLEVTMCSKYTRALTFENFWQLSISQRFAIKRIGHIAAAFGGSSE